MLDELDRTHGLNADPFTAARTRVVRAHLHDELGDSEAARAEFAAASGLATNDLERRYLARRAAP